MSDIGKTLVRQYERTGLQYLRDAADEIERLRDEIANDVIFKALRERIEELEKESEWKAMKQLLCADYHIIPTDQIRAAWKHANTHVEVESKLVEFALNELGIVRDGDGWRMG